MAYCPYCGTKITEDATTCSACEKEIKSPVKDGVDKFKGTILMPGADAAKQLQAMQSVKVQKGTEPTQTVDKGSEQSQAEANPQDVMDLQNQKRGFQATILGTGPMVAEAMNKVKKAQPGSASVIKSGDALPQSKEQGVSTSSTTASPPLNKGGTMIAGSIPLPLVPESKPVETTKLEAPSVKTEQNHSADVSGIGKTELAVPEMSIPVYEAREPASIDSQVPVLKQPEDFDLPNESKKKSSLGIWMAIGCFGMIFVTAIVGGIAYFLLL